MVFHLDTTLHADLAPLAWLVGRWAGAGLVGYPTMESQRFGQEVVCSHDGRPFLEWRSRTWLLDDDGRQVRPLATEGGFWRPVPTGFVEMYAGVADPAKVELRTDGVMRSPYAKEYTAGHRMYGYVNSNLMWVMDMAAVGQPLQSHVSAELKRVE